MSGIQAVFATAGAEHDGAAAIILPARDNHAVVLLVNRIINQRRIVGDDLYRSAARLPPQQKGGGAAVNDSTFPRRDQLRSGMCNTHFFIQTLHLVDVHWRPTGALLTNGFRAITNLFQFATSIQLVGTTSGGCG